jgi:hypothetical protein
MKRRRAIDNRICGLLFSAVLIAALGFSAGPVQGITQQTTTEDCREEILASRDFPSSENPIVVSIRELQNNPEEFYNKTVTVDGELHRDFTENVFTIDGGGIRDRDMLVISTDPKGDIVVPLEHSLKSGKSVRITGVVEPYDRGKLECAYGPLKLEGFEGHSFTKMPVLIVDRTPKKTSMLDVDALTKFGTRS